MATNVEQLKADLLADFTDFQSNVPGEGGSSEANNYVAGRLAMSICGAVERGSRLDYKGKKTSAEINALTDKTKGDIYICTDGGTLQGATPITVEANTAVIWDGESWGDFIHIDLSDYYTKAETTALVTASVATEATARASADTALSSRITALENKGLFVTNQQLRFG